MFLNLRAGCCFLLYQVLGASWYIKKKMFSFYIFNYSVPKYHFCLNDKYFLFLDSYWE